MEDVEQPSATRIAISRTSQACQRCRGLKTRCLPSVHAGICQRCSVADKECIWAEQPRRARKLRAPSRISQVEQKIDSLVTSLVNPSTARPTPDLNAPPPTARPTTPDGVRLWPTILGKERSVAPGSWLPVPLSFEQKSPRPELEIEQAEGEEVDREYIRRIRTIHRFGDVEDFTQASEGLFQPSKRPEDPIDNDLVQQLIFTHEADALVKEYRQMSASFPFVIVPEDMTTEKLHTEKPMLFLAIITAASWRDHPRQMSLDTIYRSELAHRTIISPRKTLSLVQSLLVYLSWYHFVFSHKTQQIFFLQHMVIGLAIDIALHQDYQAPNFPPRQKPPPPDPQEMRERQRAFLGCYYLASMISAGLQKPNLLSHTPYMSEWVQNLKRDRQYDSDETISHLISLRQIDDQIQDTLFTRQARDLPLSDARTLMHVRFMESQLDAWKRESQFAGSQRLLALSSSFTEMLLHSVALRAHPTSDQPTTNDTTQLNALLSTLEAGKRFLDALLSFPAHEYHLISFSEWMRLPTVIMTVARLCIPTNTHAAAGWDVKPAQDRVRLDLCLESLCYRMQQLTSYDKVKQPHPDFWYAMRFINDLTKSWYIRKIKPANSSQPTPSGTAGQTASEPSGPCSGALRSPSTDQTHQTFATFGMDVGSMNMSMGAEDNGDPFAFMTDLDFDMEQVLDMGIWSDASYNSMRFGSSMPL